MCTVSKPACHCVTRGWWQRQFSTRSRRTVADPLPGWIRLQRDLGGDEIYFDSPLKPSRDTGHVTRDNSVEARKPQMAHVTRHPSPVTAVAPEPAPFRFPVYAKGTEPTWLKGAPPVPGFGLEVTSPPPGQ